MRRKLTDDYVGGVLDKVGGFATHKNPANGKFYLYFKIVSDEEWMPKVMEFLRKKYKIDYNNYPKNGRNTFYITRMASVDILVDFMKKVCFRKDYFKYRPNKKIGIKVIK